MLFDAAIWFVAIYGAAWLRFDFQSAPVLVTGTVAFASAAALAHIVVGAVLGPYAVGHKRGWRVQSVVATPFWSPPAGC